MKNHRSDSCNNLYLKLSTWNLFSIMNSMIYEVVCLSLVCSLAYSVKVINVSTGKCLDSNTKGEVYTKGCNGGNFQNWEHKGKTFKNVATGFCLDSNTKKEVYALGCNGGTFQKWQGNSRLKNEATGFYLDSNADGKVYTGPGNGGNFQNWKLQ